ncbi:MAG: hypothetical protein ACI4QZ_05065 [Eubacteriales bacterium]
MTPQSKKSRGRILKKAFRYLPEGFMLEAKPQEVRRRFFFAEKGAKKKLGKKKAPEGDFAHCGGQSGASRDFARFGGQSGASGDFARFGGRPRLRASAGAAFYKRRAKIFLKGVIRAFS